MNFMQTIRATWRDQEIARLIGVAIKKQARGKARGKVAPSFKVLPQPQAAEPQPQATQEDKQ